MRRRLKAWRAVVAGSLLAAAGCGAADPMDALVPGERGRVVRIIDGDALVLDTGQSVRLVAIEAPAPAWRDRPEQPFADKAERILEDLALGREVRLYYAGLSRDRYDRALAHVRTIDAAGPSLWLNLEMVARGGARVRVYPDTARGAESLLEAEAAARSGRRGLWALEAYAIGRARELPSDARGFVIVEGVIGAARSPPPGGRSDRRPPACQRPFLDSGVVAEVAASAIALCDLPQGVRVRARGYVRDRRLDLTHRLNLTVLPAPAPSGRDLAGDGAAGNTAP